MNITERLKNKGFTVSFEVFPPKKSAALENAKETMKELATLSPDFISVTYGAGGGTSQNTIKIASYIQNELGTSALAHLSCVSSSREEISHLIDEMKEAKIENVLALRGDMPQDGMFPEAGYYKYAYQLVEELKERGGFSIGAACYPEGHIECESKSRDLDYLKAKVDCGCDYLTTQMFFDNSVLYSFLYRALAKGIDVPVIAGVMPVTNSRQIKRITELSGTSLTPKFRTILDKFGDNDAALKQAGIAYAIDQIVDLVANGVRGIHIYTMNKPEVARQIMESLSEILK